MVKQHGSCFVIDNLRNFHHSYNLLRWTHVLLSQPVKRNKMSGRHQLDYFRNSLLSFQGSALCHDTRLPSPADFFPLALALISSVPLLSWEEAFFHISDVYTEVSQVFIQRNQCLGL